MSRYIYWENLPNVKCSFSNVHINQISSSLIYEKTGLLVSFQSAIEFIKKDKQLLSNESIVYFGSGNFALVYFLYKNKKKYIVLKEIYNFENIGENSIVKDKLKFKILRVESMETKPLSDLYTKEEVANFPKLGSDLLSGIF